MKRFPAVLLALSLLLPATAAACGGDDKAPRIGEGPADDVHGAWQGTYMAADATQGGAFCVLIEQDGRALSGSIAFNGGAVSDIGGVISQSTLLLTWGPALEESPRSMTTDIAAGGTLNGQVTQGTASGTWIGASSAVVRGDWALQRSTAIDCSGSTPTA
jgi:hypothetical protein